MAQRTASRGYALVLVMFFIFIFSILMHSAIETSVLTSYSARNFNDHTRLFYEAETALRAIEKKLLTTEKETQGTFAHAESKITYRVRSIALDPCAVIVESTVAHYYRIDLKAESKNHSDTISLTTTEIIPAPVNETSELCRGVLHEVHAGRQSWVQN